jgi:hypothetical protein
MYKTKPIEQIKPGDVVRYKYTKDKGKYRGITQDYQLCVVKSVERSNITFFKDELKSSSIINYNLLDTLPGDQAKAGDIVVSVTEGTGSGKPQLRNYGSIHTVDRLGSLNCNIYYHNKSNWSAKPSNFVLLQPLGKVKPEPEFTYPIYKKHPHSSLVVRFEDYEFATCVMEGGGWNVGDQDNVTNHTNKTKWEDWKPEFNYDLLIQPNTVVHCTTESEANELIHWSKNQNISRHGFNSYKTEYKKYGKETCYDLMLNYCSLKFAETNNYTILTMEEARKPTKQSIENVYLKPYINSDIWVKVHSAEDAEALIKASVKFGAYDYTNVQNWDKDWETGHCFNLSSTCNHDTYQTCKNYWRTIVNYEDLFKPHNDLIDAASYPQTIAVNSMMNIPNLTEPFTPQSGQEPILKETTMKPELNREYQTNNTTKTLQDILTELFGEEHLSEIKNSPSLLGIVYNGKGDIVDIIALDSNENAIEVLKDNLRDFLDYTIVTYKSSKIHRLEVPVTSTKA